MMQQQQQLEQEEFGFISIVKLDGNKGNSFPITTPEIVIGRSLDCDIRIHLPGVSDRHCLIVFKDGMAFCKPVLGSRVFINGQALSCDTVLKTGDRIQIAERSLIFDYPAPRAIVDEIIQSAVETNQVQMFEMEQPQSREAVSEQSKAQMFTEVAAELEQLGDVPDNGSSSSKEGRCTPTPEVNAPSAESLLFSPKKTPKKSEIDGSVPEKRSILSPRKHSPRFALDDSTAIPVNSEPSSARSSAIKKIVTTPTKLVKNASGAPSSVAFMSRSPFQRSQQASPALIKPIARPAEPVPFAHASPAALHTSGDNSAASTPGGEKKNFKFGPNLSPEIFDKAEPPAKPVRRGTPSKRTIPQDPSKTMLKSVLKREVKPNMPNSAPSKPVRPLEKIEVRPLHFSPSPAATLKQSLDLAGSESIVSDAGAEKCETAPVQVKVDEDLSVKLTPSKSGRMSLGGGGGTSSFVGLKELMKTPHFLDYQGLDCLQTMLQTPKHGEVAASASDGKVRESTPNLPAALHAVKKLVKTPVRRQSEIGLEVMKHVMREPKIAPSPLMGGVKAMFKSPRASRKMTMDALDSVATLLKTPDFPSSYQSAGDKSPQTAGGCPEQPERPRKRHSLVSSATEAMLEEQMELVLQTPSIPSAAEKPQTPVKPASTRKSSRPPTQQSMPDMFLDSVPDIPDAPLPADDNSADLSVKKRLSAVSPPAAIERCLSAQSVSSSLIVESLSVDGDFEVASAPPLPTVSACADPPAVNEQMIESPFAEPEQTLEAEKGEEEEEEEAPKQQQKQEEVAEEPSVKKRGGRGRRAQKVVEEAQAGNEVEKEDKVAAEPEQPIKKAKRGRQAATKQAEIAAEEPKVQKPKRAGRKKAEEKVDVKIAEAETSAAAGNKRQTRKAAASAEEEPEVKKGRGGRAAKKTETKKEEPAAVGRRKKVEKADVEEAPAPVVAAKKGRKNPKVEVQTEDKENSAVPVGKKAPAKKSTVAPVAAAAGRKRKAAPAAELVAETTGRSLRRRN